MSFVYDGDGLRVAKTVNGVTTRYLIDTNNPTGYSQVVDELTSNQVTRTYTYGHDLISENQLISNQWTLSFYGYDGHGSTRFLTDSTGTITDTYTYDAFGNLINQTGSTPNDYLYSGEQYDSNLGFYYLRARYLNPSSGRFWIQDTDEGLAESPRSLHKYVYGVNNPVSLIDPSGHFPTPYSQDFGLAVEDEIEPIYREDHPGDHNLTFGKWGRVPPLIRLKPDILNHDKKTYLEIKPLSLSGIIQAKIKMGLNGIYTENFGGSGYSPESEWVPSRRLIHPLGVPTIFFNVEGVLFYTDSVDLLTDALTIKALSDVASLLSRLNIISKISEFGRIGELAKLATRAGSYNLQTQVTLSEATGGKY